MWLYYLTWSNVRDMTFDTIETFKPHFKTNQTKQISDNFIDIIFHIFSGAELKRKECSVITFVVVDHSWLILDKKDPFEEPADQS
jgi:hypothetical protein